MILGLVDDYNHRMNDVDQADQYRAKDPRYPTNQTWRLAYTLGYLCSTSSFATVMSSIKSQERFRVLFYQHLLQAGASTRKRKWVNYGPELELFQEALHLKAKGSTEQLEHN